LDKALEISPDFRAALALYARLTEGRKKSELALDLAEDLGEDFGDAPSLDRGVDGLAALRSAGGVAPD
jgi:hypothetical protein